MRFQIVCWFYKSDFIKFGTCCCDRSSRLLTLQMLRYFYTSIFNVSQAPDYWIIKCVWYTNWTCWRSFDRIKHLRRIKLYEGKYNNKMSLVIDYVETARGPLLFVHFHKNNVFRVLIRFLRTEIDIGAVRINIKHHLIKHWVNHTLKKRKNKT